MNDGLLNGHGHFNGVSQNVIDSIDGVIKYDSKNSESGSGKVGTLCLGSTGLCLILASCEEIPEFLHANLDIDLYVPIPSIKNAELYIDGKTVNFDEAIYLEDQAAEKLILKCKDFREIVLHFNRHEDINGKFLKAVWHKLYQNIEIPTDLQRVKNCDVHSFLDRESWEFELNRLNVNSRKHKWKIMESNEKFSSCEILGPYCVVPNSINDDVVARTGQNHINNRFMTWCWTDTETMVSLLRCSEPTTILNNNYLNKILGTINNGRAKTHAVMSTARLKDSCPNEDQISTSYEKLWNACLLKDDDSFLKNIESSKWLQHIQSFVRASRHIARTLKCDKNPVVVIDESGRDISCLVVSLVLLLCDRHYRTAIGFANLINKEWISAGYPFRSAFMSINSSVEGSTSTFLPTFIMFLDCVQNIIKQYPIEFEFTDLYLIEILDTMLEGTSPLFMFNCTRYISNMYKGDSTIVVENFWDSVLKHKLKFINPLFSLKKKILNIPSNPSNFDEEAHRARTVSYLYAVSKGYEKEDDKRIKRKSTMMLKAIRKPNLHLPFHRGRKKSKRKKDKVGSSSFFSEAESSRGRLTSIKNIFKSKFDPLNINYSLINMELWERYYFRHSGLLENLNLTEILLNELVKNITLSCSDFFSSQISDDLEHSDYEDLPRSDSVTTIASDRLERSVHLSDIDLCNDHVDKDYESAEELSLNGLSLDQSENAGLTLSMPTAELEKRLSHVFEEPEMSNSKSFQTVELEIAEATNDIHDI